MTAAARDTSWGCEAAQRGQSGRDQLAPVVEHVQRQGNPRQLGRESRSNEVRRDACRHDDQGAALAAREVGQDLGTPRRLSEVEPDRANGRQRVSGDASHR